MKHFKMRLFLMFALTAGLLMGTSCGNSEGTVETKPEQTKTDEGGQKDDEKLGTEYTSAFICPMHCKGSGSGKEGTCPVCGMDYVKNDHQD